MKITTEMANAHQGNNKEVFKLAKTVFSSGADAEKFKIYFAVELLNKKKIK